MSRMCEIMAHHQISAALRQVEEVERFLHVPTLFSDHVEAKPWSKVQFVSVRNNLMSKSLEKQKAETSILLSPRIFHTNTLLLLTGG